MIIDDYKQEIVKYSNFYSKYKIKWVNFIFN